MAAARSPKDAGQLRRIREAEHDARGGRVEVKMRAPIEVIHKQSLRARATPKARTTRPRDRGPGEGARAFARDSNVRNSSTSTCASISVDAGALARLQDRPRLAVHPIMVRVVQASHPVGQCSFQFRFQFRRRHGSRQPRQGFVRDLWQAGGHQFLERL